MHPYEKALEMQWHGKTRKINKCKLKLLSNTKWVLFTFMKSENSPNKRFDNALNFVSCYEASFGTSAEIRVMALIIH